EESGLAPLPRLPGVAGDAQGEVGDEVGAGLVEARELARAGLHERGNILARAAAAVGADQHRRPSCVECASGESMATSAAQASWTPASWPFPSSHGGGRRRRS